MYFPIFDGSIVVLIPAIILAFYAQFKVKSTFNKYLKVPSRTSYTGEQMAREVLGPEGRKIKIERGEGQLTDHYDPRKKTIRLSPEVYRSNSLAALGVAAHEAAHALQDLNGYAPLGIRNLIFPAANIGSRLGIPLAFIGFLFASEALIIAGIIFFSGAVLFQIATLPVEFNASNRALQVLEHKNILASNEMEQVKKVLDAAALTYVAATAVAIAHLLRMFLLLAGSRR